jgi:hypothetical protein
MAIDLSDMRLSENQQYRKFLLLIEVAPAMIKVLQRGKDAGPGLTAELDRVVSMTLSVLMIYLLLFIID